MRLRNYHLRILSLLLFFLFGVNNAMPEPEKYKTYIVHMDHSRKPSSFLTHESWHRATLRSLSKPVDDKDMLLYSYNHVMHGFSARLTPSQVSELKKSPAHVATREEAFGKLFTTHSPEFLGLRHSFGLWNASSYGEGVIIALIDSGVWPESESFNEKGMPPIPTRWKGKCQNSTRNPFPCNRKLIGAQTFIKGSQAAGITDSPDDSPRDFLGHGTHTSSTAAGNHVPGASQFGYAKGIARGIAPRAHVAMYKVSSGPFIVESDVLAAMDQAISDGVDIMSLSLGFQQTPYFQDIIAIASLSAIQKGIVVVCAAGNDGAQNSTHNAAPWITTVGAGTLDRSFTATVTLGNNLTFEGKSEFPERVLILDTPLYYGKGDFNKRICNIGALNKSEVFGKVVICDNSNRVSIFDQATELANVGAVAGILMADWTPFGVDGLSIPSLVLPTSSGALIKKYAIGAADTIDNNGTTLTNELTNLPGTPLEFGAGHINPNKAMSPGLIYDIDWQGYVDFLCGLGYNDAEMRAILRQSQWNCSQEGTDLNYPSFVAIFGNNGSSPNVKNFTRVVTNVEDDQSVYQAVAETPNGMSIRVEPGTLTFTKKYQKQTYVVSVEMDSKAPPVAYGYLKWIDQNNHVVASPVVVLNF
ncbi:hypothetical protein QUC31_000036 [Theobroma cacao]